MKCIKLTSSKRIIRCEDKVADMIVEKGIGVFINKEKWKEDGRNYLTKEDLHLLKGVLNSGSK